MQTRIPSSGFRLISACALYFFLISILVVHFDIRYILSMLLFFAVPAIYFSSRNTAAIPKNLFYAFSFSVPTTIVLDYMAHVSHAWYVPSVFSLRMLSAFPIEELAWSFLFFYAILAFYNGIYRENFDSRIRSNNNKYLLGLILLIMPAFFLLLIFNKELLVVGHFYLLMVIFVMALPSAVALFFQPHLRRKIFPLTLVFAAFFIFFYERSALKTGQWMFLTDYIGWIRFFDVRFPVEELLFALFAVPGTIGVYEFFSGERQGNKSKHAAEQAYIKKS